MSYESAIEYLYGLQWHGIKLGLDNPRALLARAGNPHLSFRTAHIAGTNGKGSTSAMLCHLLMRSGLRTALFVSPHMLSFTERISVDMAQISRDEVVEYASRVRGLAEGMAPTFFEVVTAMAMLYFRDRAADAAVFETGMGGRLDATNIIAPEVAAITPIGMDHAEFLGDTIEKVASEKAGIIKKGVPVVSAAQSPDAARVIAEAASAAGAQLYIEGDQFHALNIRPDSTGVTFDYASDTLSAKGVRVPLFGSYQARNAALAIKCAELMGAASAITPDAFEALRWPGRLQRAADSPPTYIDGAHNPPAARALASELSRAEGFEGLALVMGVMKDKDVSGIVRPLLPLASEVFFCAPAYGRAAKPAELAAIARAAGCAATIHAMDSVADAIAAARATGRTVLVAGSFYTAGEAFEALGMSAVFGTLRESGPITR